MKPDPRHVEGAKRWKTLGPELQRIRDDEIRRADTYAAIVALDSAFKAAFRDLAERTDSGLVEWGKLVMKWRDRARSD